MIKMTQIPKSVAENASVDTNGHENCSVTDQQAEECHKSCCKYKL